MIVHPVRMLAGLVAAAALATSAAADEGGDSAASRAAALRSAGRYGDCEALVREALASVPADPAVNAELLLLLLETGRYGDAAVPGAAESDPRCAALRAEALLRLGRTEEAFALAEAAVGSAPECLRARHVRGLILLEKGDRRGALTEFEWFFDHYAVTDVRGPEDLTLVADASLRVALLSPAEEMDFRVTMKILDAVTRDHPEYLPAFIVKGDLYLRVYQDQDARKAYEAALKTNPRFPPALLGLAEQGAFRFDELSGVGRCREALRTNPNLYEAREFLARVALGDSEYGEAAKEIEAVLAVNPRRKETLSLGAALSFLRGDREGHAKKVAELLALDARFGRVHWELAAILEQHRRFADAAEAAGRAVAVDPEDYAAHWILGRNLVHIAREKEARAALTRSKELDPFAHYAGNAFRENMAEVLKHLEEFVETRSANFVYKIHGGENAVLSRYYHRLFERSWDLLTKKYGFTPAVPILAEVFHVHADFAARTIGLPGIGALGACFGQVITLDSPSSRRPGEFSWAATAHHEFAHAVTLQLSKGRVPRWFTEGLSVYEERRFADWWARDMDRELFDALANGEIPPILEFNREFRGPRVLFAYYLGGLMCEFIEEAFGFPKIVEMLKAFAEDRQTEDVLKEVLGVTPAEYDGRFREFVVRMVGGLRLVPRWSDRTVRALEDRLYEAPQDAEALVRLAFAALQRGRTVDAQTLLGKALAVAPEEPRLLLLRGLLAAGAERAEPARKWLSEFLAAGGDDLFARIHLAGILEKEGDLPGAIAHLEAAKLCFPSYAGERNPWAELARIRLSMEDLEGAMRELEGYVRLANTDIDNRLKLADFYEGRGDWRALARVLGEVVLIYPLGEKSSMPVHVRLARALARLEDPEGAVMEYEVALELGVPPAEEPPIRAELGEVYRLLGREADARRQAEAALEAQPDLKAARELLERIRR